MLRAVVFHSKIFIPCKTGVCKTLRSAIKIKIRSHNLLVKLTTRILITNDLTTMYLMFQAFIDHKKRGLMFTTKLTAIPSRNINSDFDLAF